MKITAHPWVAFLLHALSLPASGTEAITELPGTPGRAAAAITPATAQADGRYEVDLLLLYTASSLPMLPDGMAADAAERVSKANQIFDNSEIPVRYRLVGALPYPAQAEPVLRDLPDTPEVTRLRDQYGADLVSVLNGTPDPVACGQSISFNGGLYAADQPNNIDPQRDGYSVVFCLDGKTFAHELGHSLGAGHDYTFSGVRDPVTHMPTPGVDTVVGSGYWKDYAHAWRCGKLSTPGASRCDIMHYCAEPDAQLHFRITGEPPFGDFFSNPRMSRDGEACGSEGPVEALQADNARSITEAAPYVAAYRDPAPGTKAQAARGGQAFGGALGGAWVLMILALWRSREAG